MTLWHEVAAPQSRNISVTDIAFSQNVNDDGDVTSQTLGLLPIASKEGDCLKKRHASLSGADLKNLHKDQSMELKKYMLSQAGNFMANPKIGGAQVKVTANRVSLIYKRFPDQVGLVSDEAIAKAMGRTVEWVQKHMRKTETIDIPATTDAAKPGLKPAPQNGLPELKPAKKSRTKKTAPSAPQAPEAPVRS